MSKMNRQIKECYEFFIKTVESEPYKDYVAKREAQHREVKAKYISEKAPGHTDLYDPDWITEVKVFDVLSNAGVSKLLKQIYALSPIDYKAEVYYKEPSLVHQYDYVHLQLSGVGQGLFAKITLLHDKYIKNIELSWSQINSFSAFMEYTISFKKSLNEDTLHEFVLDGIRTLKRKDYRGYYIVRKNRIDANYEWISQLENEIFHYICQHYITSLFFSEHGKEMQLNNLVVMTRKAPIDINTLDLGFLTTVYHNKEENYVIQRHANEPNYYLLAGSNRVPSISIISFISSYGNSFYYAFNGEQELKLFERHFSQYTSGRKHISKKALLSIINRLQGLKEDYWSD